VAVLVRQGPPGPPGPPGPAGSAGSAVYIFTQAGMPAATWVIPHGLGRYPNVKLFHSSGEVMQADWAYTDINTITIGPMVAAVTGKAYLS